MQKVLYKSSEKGLENDENKRFEVTENILSNLIKIVMKTFPEFASPLKKIKLRRLEEKINLTTDGYLLFYNYKNVKDSYGSYGYRQLFYQLIHTILHYINEDNVALKKYKDKELINNIADQNVQTVLLELGIKDPDDICFGLLFKKIGYPHYSYYECMEDLNKRKQIISLKNEWFSDSHELWNYSQDRKHENELIRQAWAHLRELVQEGGEGSADLLNGVVKLVGGENRKIFYGDGTCDVIQIHSPDKNKLCMDFESDLSDFLLNAVKTDVNSLDRNLYMYGLELYDDMPLVEPLDEDEDSKGLGGNLFIAIDTSGSTIDYSGRFTTVLGECLDYLKKYMLDKEVTLLQCDTEIKSEKHFKSSEINPEMFKDTQLIGYGGTNFCSVFEHIKKYIDSGGTTAGLIYLSDGYGEFPSEKTWDYPVLFVLPEEDDELELPEYVKRTVIKNA